MQDAQDLAYARWRRAPEPFWAEAAEAVSWYRRWNQVLDGSREPDSSVGTRRRLRRLPPKTAQVLDGSRAPFYRWFSGGVVNTCYNALDRHVAAGRADQPALIYDSPVTHTIACFTYRELLDCV